MKAIIPAAGLGTRMRPVTRAVPKEMLPVGRKPMLHHVVEELVASGVGSICIVVRPGKPAIRDYFSAGAPADRNDEVEALLARCSIDFVDQPEPRGLGDALLQAREFAAGEPFVMAIPDQLFDGPSHATAQLLERWQPGPAVWSSLVEIPAGDLGLFPGARGFRYTEAATRTVTLDALLDDEQTRAAERPGRASYTRGFGRTVFPPEIFDYLGPDFVNPATGEVDLLRTFRSCRDELDLMGVILEGRPMDLGTFDGYYHFLPRFWSS